MDRPKTPIQHLPKDWQEYIRELERLAERLHLKLLRKGRIEKKLRAERKHSAAP